MEPIPYPNAGHLTILDIAQWQQCCTVNVKVVIRVEREGKRIFEL